MTSPTKAELAVSLATANRRIAELESARLRAEAAAALEIDRLGTLSEQRAGELAILNSVGEAMAKTLDVKTVTRIVGDKVRDIFSAEAIEVLLRDPKSDLIHVHYAYYRDYLEIEPFVMGQGITSRVLLSGKPLVISTWADSLALGAIANSEAEKTESYLGVPINAGDQTLGVVSVQSYQQNAFNDGHVRLLQTLASNMGVAIANARLFDETQRLLKITEDRNAELAFVNGIQEVLASGLEMQAIYDKIGDKIAEIFDAQVVDIGILDPNDNLIHFPYTIERGVRYPDEPIHLSGFRKHVAETGQPIRVVRNMETEAPRYGAKVIQGEMPKSVLFMPMLVGGEVKGFLSLQNLDHEDAFSESDVSLLTTIANATSVALEKARLFTETVRLLQETKERNAELAFVNGVQEVLVSNVEMQSIYDQIGDKIHQIFNAQVVDIGLLDPDDNLIHFPYTIERGVRFPDVPIALIGFRKHAMETRQPLLINEDVEGANTIYGNPQVIQGEPPKSMLYVPMIVEGQAKGVISLQNLDQENAFSQSDVSLLTTIGNATSIAIEKARLFTETQRLLKVTEDRAAELGAISKVSEALIAESELDSTIQLIGNQMLEIFNADIVYVALLDSATGLIHFPYQVGETFTTLKLGEGLTGKIIETGEPILINQNVLKRSVEIGAIPVGKEALSYLGVPIKTTQGTIGVISVQSTTQEGIFTDDSLRLLTTIAANAGAALHNAQLFSNALEHLRQVEILTNAANAIERRSFEPAMIEGVAARGDALGELARVFRNMAQEVRVREQRLRRQLQQLQLDIEEKQQAKAETIAVYIPMDRRQALAQGKVLPEATQGTALFADVSGFTPLTEQLAIDLGLQRGAEEIIRHLNRVFSVLIDELHRFGGAVIGFSGDAITCWFDDCALSGARRPAPAAERAVAAALAMQKGMAAFAAIATPSGKTIGLAIKVAAATGPARRFIAGQSQGHEIDVLAGGTLVRLSEAEHEAERGEIVIATTGVGEIDSRFTVSAWRSGRSFAVVSGIKAAVVPEPWPELAADAVAEDQARPWLLAPVFEKVRAGKSDLLSELRPVTALFVKFAGIDFDTDADASARFDRFIQWVEQVIAPHNGSIVQVTVGDKGSYLYVAFGAPVAHNDDAPQAVAAALELAAPPPELDYITSLQLGMAAGQMRVGAYGGAAHRTYGALGDKTNLAARLMVAARPAGHRALILCDASVYEATQAQFEFEPMPPVSVKGKSEPIPVYRPVRKFGDDEVCAIDFAAGAGQRTLLIDRLPPAEQLTIKVASVIGQSFTVDTLSALYPEPHDRDTLLAHLHMLVGREFIVALAPGSSAFSFRDAATHNTAYALMLFAQRRQLHRAMAELLEQAADENPPYAEIAHHWQASDEIPKAVAFLEKAGEQARNQGRFDDASRFLNSSLELNA